MWLLLQKHFPMIKTSNIMISSFDQSDIPLVTIDGINSTRNGNGKWQLTGMNLIMLDSNISSLEIIVKKCVRAHVVNCILGYWMFSDVKDATIDNCSYDGKTNIRNRNSLNFIRCSVLIQSITINSMNLEEEVAAFISIENSFVTVEESTFTKCKVPWGLITAINNSYLVINSCNFTQNTANLTGVITMHNSSKLISSNCLFSKNLGKSVISIANNSIVKVLNATFSQNRGTDSFTSCIHVKNDSSAIVYNCNFRHSIGTAISCIRTTQLLMLDSTFYNNSSPDLGGAIYGSESCALKVLNVAFYENLATYQGGAIFIRAHSKLVISDSNFTRNLAGIACGAVYARGSSIVFSEGCMFSENGHGSVCIIDFSVMNILGTQFRQNKGNISCIIATQFCDVVVSECTFDRNSGGAISALTDNVYLRITDSLFQNNSLSLDGTVVFAESMCTLDISNSIFQHNLATSYGAVMYIHQHCKVLALNSTFLHNLNMLIVAANDYSTANISSSQFINNKGVRGEGAVRIHNNSVSIIDYSIFALNVVGINGSVIEVLISSSLLATNCIFRENFADDNNGLVNIIHIVNNSGLKISSSTFEGNNVPQGSAIGSSLHCNLSISNSSFLSNVGALTGGAVYASLYCKLTILDSLFHQNIAGSHDGRECRNAILHSKTSCSEGNLGVLTIAFNVTLHMSNVTFIENSAIAANAMSNCVITIEHSLFGSNAGSAINIFNATTLVIEHSQFVNNLSPSYGGAISASSQCTVKASNVAFQQNIANYGGVVYLSDSTFADFRNCQLKNNSARISGGALKADNAVIGLYKSNFSYNHANLGGVIGIHSGILLSFDCSIEGNYANQGGVIYTDGNGKITVKYCHFNSNRAITSGGVLFARNSTVFIQNAIFENNVADADGAVLDARTFCIVNISLCKFFRNKANSGQGGVIFGEQNSTFIMKGAIIFDNHAYRCGAIFLNLGCGLEMYQSHIYENTADDVGIVCLHGKSELITINSYINDHKGCAYGCITIVSSTVYFENCTLNRNHGKSWGGAIAMRKSTLKLSMMTLANSTAKVGGSIFIDTSTAPGTNILETYLSTFVLGAVTLNSHQEGFIRNAFQEKFIGGYAGGLHFLTYDRSSLIFQETPYASGEILHSEQNTTAICVHREVTKVLNQMI